MGARQIRPLRKLRKLVRRLRGSPAANRGYLVCSSPRCGSTYFCQLLASTGALGNPREYLNVAGRWGQLDRERPTNLLVLLDRVLKAGATPNGIYAVKAHADHFAAIGAVVDPLRILPGLKFVRLRRRDLLSQAISWARAEQTRQFRSTDRETLEPIYDAMGIRRSIAQLIEQDATWERLFATVGCAPLEIEYEVLMRFPQRQVDRVAQLMSVAEAVPVDPQRVKVTIQRDALNAEWRSRFLADTGDEFRHLAYVATTPLPRGSASAS